MCNLSLMNVQMFGTKIPCDHNNFHVGWVQLVSGYCHMLYICYYAVYYFSVFKLAARLQAVFWNHFCADVCMFMYVHTWGY